MKKVKLIMTGMIKPTPGSPVNMGQAYENLQAAIANGGKNYVGNAMDRVATRKDHHLSCLWQIWNGGLILQQPYISSRLVCIL